jgi:hypothetical protein
VVCLLALLRGGRVLPQGCSYQAARDRLLLMLLLPAVLRLPVLVSNMMVAPAPPPAPAVAASH